MNIKVENVTFANDAWTITFNTPVTPGVDSAIGTRVIRIFTQTFGQQAILVADRSDAKRILVGSVTKNAAVKNTQYLNSAADLQRLIDKYANKKLQLTFGKPTVTPKGSNRPISSMSELQQWRSANPGGVVVVEQILQLDMPAAPRDLKLLEELLPSSTIEWVAGSSNQLSVAIPLEGKLLTEDPWKLIKSYEKDIKATVA